MNTPNLYITLPQWTSLRSRLNKDTDPHYVQSYVQRNAISPADTSLRVCITFNNARDKTIFMLKYSEYIVRNTDYKATQLYGYAMSDLNE